MKDQWETFNEPDFVTRLKDRDREAWGELVSAKYSELKRAARRAGSKDPSLVEHSVNEGLGRAFEKIGIYDHTKGSLRSWFHTIVNNEARDEARQESRQRGNTVSDTIFEELPGSAPGVDPDFARRVELEEAFNLLDPVDKQSLRDAANGVPDADIARRDRINPGAVRKRRSRARSHYQEIIGGKSD